MPVLATNAPTIANAAANTAGKPNNSAPAKDSDDKSFSEFLTEQTPDKTPGKTDTMPKAKTAPDSRSAGKSINTKSRQLSGGGKPTATADAKSGSKKLDGVKQDRHDTQTDSTDDAPAPDVQTASNVAQQPLLLPADAGNQDDDSNSNNDAGNQSGQPGSDAAPASDVNSPAPDTSATPPLPQINNDAMAQAAAASMPPPAPPPSTPVSPPPQTGATPGIDATQKGSRPRVQASAQADATPPTPDSESDADTDTTSADAPAPVVASTTPQTPPPATTAQNSQDDDGQDSGADGASTADIAVQSAANANAPAPQPASVPTAPAVSPPPTSHTRAPRTPMAQNDAQTVTDTASANTAPAKPAPQTNQPLNTANADNTVQTPNASQAPKPETSDIKIASAKDGDSQTQDARSAADTNVSASQTPAPQSPQPPAPSPVIALAAGITPQAIGGGTTPAVTTNVHVGPQTPDVTPNVNGLAVEIAAKSQSGARQFDIRLDPPELGRVEVRLSIDATGKAEAHMTADQPQTLHLLQKDSETLTRALRDAGLDVSQNGLNFSLRGQDRQNSNGQNNSGQGGNFRALQATKVIEALPTNSIAYSSTGNARLDIHV